MATSGSFSTSYYKNLCMKVTWEVKSQSIENNTSTIAWSLQGERNDTAWGYITCGNFTVTINGETVYSTGRYDRVDIYNGTVVTSGEITIPHNDDGSKIFAASVSAAIYEGEVNSTGTGSFELPTIPRKSSLTASDGTLGTAQTLTINRYSTSFAHTITYTCGSASGTVCDKSSNTSISFTPPLDLAEQNTSGVSVAIVLTTITYSGSTEIGRTTQTITCAIPASVKPTCSLSVSDAMGYLSTYGGYIKGQSKLKVVVTSAGSYGSSITSIKTTANGATYTAASFTTDVIKTSGTLTISVTVTDSRGRTGTASVSVTVLDYTAPTITALSTVRCNSDGTANEQGEYVKVIFSSAVTSLSSKNTATYTLKYKVSTASSYTSVTLTAYNKNYAVSNGSYIFAAGTGSSYDITLVVADAFIETSSAVSAPTAFALMHWKADGTAVGIGKVAEKSYTLDLGVDVELNDNKVLNNGVEAFAPVGYGYGEALQIVTGSTDAECLQNIEALCAKKISLSTFQAIIYPVGTQFDGNSFIAQIWHNTSSEHKYIKIKAYGTTTNLAFQRVCYISTWSEPEWVNPPMVVGVEYRTTERYMGMVVYAKLINFGYLPNASSGSVPITGDGIAYPVRANLLLGGSATATGTAIGNNYPYISEFYTSTDTIIIRTNANSSSTYARVEIYYTKG